MRLNTRVVLLLVTLLAFETSTRVAFSLPLQNLSSSTSTSTSTENLRRGSSGNPDDDNDLDDDDNSSTTIAESNPEIWKKSPGDRNAIELPLEIPRNDAKGGKKEVLDSVQQNIQSQSTSALEHQKRVEEWNNMFDESVHEFQQMGIPQEKLNSLRRVRPLLEGLIDAVDIEKEFRTLHGEAALAQLTNPSLLTNPHPDPGTSAYANKDGFITGSHHPHLDKYMTNKAPTQSENLDIDSVQKLLGVSFSRDQLTDMWEDVLADTPHNFVTSQSQPSYEPPEVLDTGDSIKEMGRSNKYKGIPIGHSTPHWDGSGAPSSSVHATDADFAAEELHHNKLTQVDQSSISDTVQSVSENIAGSAKQAITGFAKTVAGAFSQDGPRSHEPSQVVDHPDGTMISEQSNPSTTPSYGTDDIQADNDKFTFEPRTTRGSGDIDGIGFGDVMAGRFGGGNNNDDSSESSSGAAGFVKGSMDKMSDLGSRIVDAFQQHQREMQKHQQHKMNIGGHYVLDEYVPGTGGSTDSNRNDDDGDSRESIFNKALQRVESHTQQAQEQMERDQEERADRNNLHERGEGDDDMGDKRGVRSVRGENRGEEVEGSQWVVGAPEPNANENRDEDGGFDFGNGVSEFGNGGVPDLGAMFSSSGDSKSFDFGDGQMTKSWGDNSQGLFGDEGHKSGGQDGGFLSRDDVGEKGFGGDMTGGDAGDMGPFGGV